MNREQYEDQLRDVVAHETKLIAAGHTDAKVRRYKISGLINQEIHDKFKEVASDSGLPRRELARRMHVGLANLTCMLNGGPRLHMCRLAQLADAVNCRLVFALEPLSEDLHHQEPK